MEGYANNQQTQDVKLQKVQELLMTAIVPLVTVTDSTLSNKRDLHRSDSGNNLIMILESITLLLEVHHELNLRRREAIRPSLKDEFRPLCSKNTKLSNDLLLGDNLDEQIKQLQNKCNLGSSLCKHSRDKNKGTYRNRYQPYNPNFRNQSSASYRNKKDFLGKQPPPKPRSRGTHNY